MQTAFFQEKNLKANEKLQKKHIFEGPIKKL